MKKFLLMILATLFMFSSFLVVPAQAASNPAYAYTYTDTDGITHYKYYVYSPSANMYRLTRELRSKGGKNLYTDAGTLLSSSLYRKDQEYNVYDKEGNFFFITTTGETRRIKLNSTTQEVVMSSGSKYFIYDDDDLGVYLMTSSGKKLLSGLKPGDTPGTDEPEKPDQPQPVNPTPAKAKNRIDKSTNSFGEMVNQAYKDSKLKLTIIVSRDESSVLNKTAGVRLTETLKGAKFAGIDKNFNVYLYELPGTLYKFTYGSWYSASKLSLSGSFKKYIVDSNGFVTSFVTTSGTFTIKDLESKNKWVAKKTYAVTKSNYVTLYIKGKSSSKTLKLTSGNLYLGKKKIASGVKKFGFVSKKKLCYIKGGKCYTASISNPKKAKLFVKSASSLKKNSSNGLINKVVLKNKKKVKIK